MEESFAGPIALQSGPATPNPTGVDALTAVVEWPGGVHPSDPLLAAATDLSLRSGDGSLLAWVTVLAPGFFPSAIATTRADAADLQGTGFIARVAVRAGADRDAVLAYALYAAVRELRIQGVTTVAIRRTATDAVVSELLALRTVPGLGDAANEVGAVDVPYAMIRLADAASNRGLPIPAELFGSEITRMLEAYFAQVWKTAWFRAVYEQRLSREAYVYTLGNTHQFVRFTTRLIGRCVAFSADSYLRAHFARHLREEINHELIIEQDLLHLGEDVDYVVRRMSPNAPTRRFMASQESAVAFHQDPILMLAAPLAAEGIAGRLDQRFMDALHGNVRRWGVQDPARATRFYSSHIEFDGGDDGHFAGTIQLLQKYIHDESRLQLFLSFLSASTEAMLASYESYQRDLRLFSATTH